MPVKVVLLDKYVQIDYVAFNDTWHEKPWRELGLGTGIISIPPLRLINKVCVYPHQLNEYICDKNIKNI